MWSPDFHFRRDRFFLLHCVERKAVAHSQNVLQDAKRLTNRFIIFFVLLFLTGVCYLLQIPAAEQRIDDKTLTTPSSRFLSHHSFTFCSFFSSPAHTIRRNKKSSIHNADRQKKILMFPMTSPCQSFCFNNFFFFDDSVNFLSSETKNVHMNQHPFHYLFDLLENLTNALLPNCACKETRAHSAVSRFTVLESSIAPVLIIERDGHFLITILTWFFSSYISEKEKNNVLLLLCECVHRVQTDTLGASVSTKKKKKLNSILHDFS